MSIRPANKSDLSAITEIYNESIANSVASFNTEAKTFAEQEAWYADLESGNHPFLVAEEDNEVIGYACLAPWNDRCGYNKTAEISTYIHKDHRGKGLGFKLKKQLIEMGRANGLHTIISRVAGANPANEKINEKLGFVHIGTMKEVGYKFGKYIDVHMFQLIL